MGLRADTFVLQLNAKDHETKCNAGAVRISSLFINFL